MSFSRNVLKYFIILVLFFPIVGLSGTSIPSLPPVDAIPKPMSNGLEFIRGLDNAWQNLEGCLAAGFAMDYCRKEMILCQLQDAAFDGYLGLFGGVGWILGLQDVFGAFKLRCDGECFWCCVTQYGCHSSFGPSPVVNCQELSVSPGAHTLGHTMIVGNPTGTDSCLIPQTCDHFAQCKIANQGGGAFPPPQRDWQPTDPAVTSDPPTRDVRAKELADAISRKLITWLDTFPADIRPYEMGDFVRNRGCQASRKISTIEPYQGNISAFAVKDVNGNILSAPSKRFGIITLSTIKILASIPNLRKRLDYVESRIWTVPQKESYLASAGIEDADAELLKTMSPIGLNILKQVENLQDYRLLAVPLAGETTSNVPYYDGCESGRPPRVTLTPSSPVDSNFGVSVCVDDPEYISNYDASHPLAIEWGDGTSDQYLFNMENNLATYFHTYPTSDERLITVTLSNSSGLRGVTRLVVKPPAGSHGPLVAPSFTSVTFPDAQLKMSARISAGKVHLQVLQQQPDGIISIIGERFLSPGNNIDIPLQLGGFPRVPVPVTALILKTTQSGGDWFDLTNSYISLKTLHFEIYSTVSGTYISRDVVFTPSTLEVYYGSSSAPFTAPLKIDSQGRVMIPIERIEGRLASIRIPLDPSKFPGVDALYHISSLPVGTMSQWLETRRNHFEQTNSFGGSCTTVTQASQKITFNTLPIIVVGGNGNIAATGGASGNPVTFTSKTPDICTVNGKSVTGITAQLCMIAANQDGNANYSAAPQEILDITVGKADQSIGIISFTPATLVVDHTTAISASATSGLAVNFISSTPNICTTNGTNNDMLTGIAAGTCVISAYQPGDANYNAAPVVTQSIVAVGLPDTPSIGIAKAGNSVAMVSFESPTNTGGNEITGYILTSNPSGLTATGSTSPITISGLNNGTAYTFTVRATNAIGTSAASAASNRVIPGVPDAPTLDTATPGNRSVSIAFAAPANNGSAITGYTATCNDITADGASSPIVLMGLTNGTVYSCLVTATNAVGTSAASKTVTVIPRTIPGAPLIGSATAGNAQAIVTFAVPKSDGSSAITSYTVISSPGRLAAIASESPITITGLTNGTGYTFKVTATNAAGKGAASEASNKVMPFDVPSVPKISTVTLGNGKATINFRRQARNSYSPVIIYTATCNGNLKTSSNESPIVVTGLTNGTAYTCSVTATNAVGTSAPSKTFTVTPRKQSLTH